MVMYNKKEFMMKNKIKYFALIMVIFLLSGCYKININMGVKTDKSVSFDAIVSVDMDKVQSFNDELQSYNDELDELIEQQENIWGNTNEIDDELVEEDPFNDDF